LGQEISPVEAAPDDDTLSDPTLGVNPLLRET
jgi:hypothetical protein